MDHGFPQGFNHMMQNIAETPSIYQGYHWLELIQCYSKLKIAKDHDRLPALSGLAQVYQQTDPNSRYLAGIWDNWLLPSLAWRRASLGKAMEGDREGFKVNQESPEESDQSQWCTPSWSWASIGDSVIFEGNEQWAKAFVCLRGADCEPSTIHNPWGNVRHGKLHVSGPISAFGPNEQHRCELGHETELNYDYDAKDLAGKEIECLVLGLETSSYEKHGRHPNDLESWNRQVSLSIKIFGLLLEPVDVDTATYRRVGLLRYYHEGRGPYAIDKSRRGVWWY
ncbi:heterokaryon incompatibility protein [Colletotrichum asianum]|uniref:Heterokaryon incompatibility protein n=1 Tax=Colletotrichum asianum TaxID=702518 RepID=A0A8H3WAY5_9PEZI|nr:heterokaryon incompatibility protein [Colletotrichum asianum]